MPATAMPTSNTLLAWNNYVLTSGLSATSQALPVTNIQNERGSASEAWQTAAGVTQNVILTITPNLRGQTWRAFGVFRTNLTAFATVTVTLWNSPGLQVWASGTDGPEPGYGQSILVAPTDVVADYCTIEIDDAGNRDNFLNIPLVYAGPAWMTASPPSYDTTFGGDAAVNDAISRGGQEFPTLLYERRRIELAFTGIRQGEVLGQLAELNATARRGNNILFVPDVSSETMSQEALYGRLSATADIGFPYGGADRRSWRARLTERL